MNSVNLVGRLTRDPEVRSIQNGEGQVVNFALAVNRIGEGADFPNIVAFNKSAEIIGKYCNKGSRIGVKGHLQTRKYQDKEDRTVYSTEVIVEQIDLLDSRSDAAAPPTNPEPAFKEVTADPEMPF